MKSSSANDWIAAAALEAARTAWSVAEVASAHRHAARESRNRRAATAFGRIKASKILRCTELVPTLIRVRDHVIRGRRYLSIRFRNKRALHLPAQYEGMFRNLGCP